MEKKARTREDIQMEYSQLCARAGQLQYQIYALGKDLEIVDKSLLDLNLEAAKLDQDASAAKAIEEAAAKEAEVASV